MLRVQIFSAAVVFACSARPARCALEPPAESDTIVRELLERSKRLSNRNRDGQHDTVSIFDAMKSGTLPHVNRMFADGHDRPVLIGNANRPMPDADASSFRASLTLVWLDDAADLNRTVETLEGTYLYTPRECALFVVATRVDGVGFLNDFFATLWRNYLLRSVVVFFFEERVHFFAYDPFADAGRMRAINVTGSADAAHPCDARRDLNGHRLEIGVFSDPPNVYVARGSGVGGTDGFVGVDGILLASIMREMNATYRVRTPKHGQSFEGALRDLKERRTDFAFNSRFTYRSDDAVEHTYPYTKSDVHIVVPKGRQIPQYLNIYNIYTPTSWLVVNASFALALLTVYLLRRFAATKPKSTWIGDIYFELYGLLIAASIKWTHRAASEKAFVLTYCIVMFLVCSIFQSALTSVLIDPRYGRDLATLDDLYESKLPIVTTRLFGDIFDEQKNMSRTLTDLSERVTVVDDDRVFDAMMETNGSDTAFAVVDSTARFFVGLNRNVQNGRRLYHIVGEKFIPGLASYVASRGSPYLDRVDRIIVGCHEAGLWQQFSVQNSHDILISGVLESAPLEEKPKLIKLNMGILQSAFQYVILGYIMGGIVFVFEILIHKKIIVWDNGRIVSKINCANCACRGRNNQISTIQ